MIRWCKRCNGSGRIVTGFTLLPPFVHKLRCLPCGGTGYARPPKGKPQCPPPPPPKK